MVSTFHFNFFHIWWAVRLFAVLSTPIFLVELEFLFFVQGLIFLHVHFGLVNIIKDYLHNGFLQLVCFLISRILIIELVGLIIDFCQ